LKKGIAVLSVLLLSACGTVEASKESRFTETDGYLDITTDKETGCKYLISTEHNFGGGITPLLKSDGTPDCEIQ
jgi:hypothetical protein